MKLRAVVVDDEELARVHLVKIASDAEIEVIGEGANGLDALNLTESLCPDILFLDIRMPDMTGLQAAAAVGNFDKPPRIVFVTGFTEHASEAFELRAFDYLTKPVSPDRLARTIQAIEAETAHREAHAKEAIKMIQQELTPIQHLPVRTAYSIKLVRLKEIEYAVARDKKVFLRTNGVEQRTYYTLSQLESLLPITDFMRIHWSAIVRLSLIDAVNLLGNHTYSATLVNGQTLPISRASYPGLRARLGF